MAGGDHTKRDSRTSHWVGLVVFGYWTGYRVLFGLRDGSICLDRVVEVSFCVPGRACLGEYCLDSVHAGITEVSVVERESGGSEDGAVGVERWVPDDI